VSSFGTGAAAAGAGTGTGAGFYGAAGLASLVGVSNFF